MSIRSFFVRLSMKAATVVVFAWAGASASAADVTPATPATPAVVGAPVSVGEAGGCASCQSCQHGAIRSACNVCGKLLGGHLHKDKKAPYPVTLCPGACFGYFQTQWRKWDEVCPYPYLGIGVSDAPKTLRGRPAGTELNVPRPVDPKLMPTDPKLMPDPKKVGSLNLPAIPVVPANKFAP